MKRTQIKLNSICKDGIGHSVGAELLPTLYEFLLHKEGQDYYKSITVLQISDTEEERVGEIPTRNGFVRIIRDTLGFDLLDINEKNIVRLGILHEGLLRLANDYKKIDIGTLQRIKEKVLKNNFEFEFIFKSAKSVQNNIVVDLSVAPGFESFKYYVTIRAHKEILCRQLIYVGLADFYYNKFVFNKIVIKKEDVSIFDKDEHAEIKVNIKNCFIDVLNHSLYSNPPEYTFWRGDITKQQRDLALKDKNDFGGIKKMPNLGY